LAKCNQHRLAEFIELLFNPLLSATVPFDFALPVVSFRIHN
jgi:hypothetical protein